ncbi:hypothetical protein QBC34DRAFT_413654 [Podospora aff. communis PSN243]|uniref:Uncharacterized protein n=1 Tax=Podospora aff. communis PSN243 TaxID=3040156 RepID=A0AAV9GCS3_9PEZI|nr:hypothetical protein QBC34DRAFT_413654 [Podospora aff. communis PSN243]
MEPISALSVAATVITTVDFAVKLSAELVATLSTAAFVARTYGIAGIGILLFGSKDVMRSEFEVLASDNDQVATDFKKATQDESNMIAVAGTIVAQIAITALSLSGLSQAHWAARGLFTFSLVSSIIAVYYASSQHRTIGRCLNASQIRAWIVNNEGWGGVGFYDTRKCMGTVRKPCASSILSISAPVLLLSASLNSFLAGFGVYLGFVWTRNLDGEATTSDSRGVFLVYVIALGVCYGIYALSFMISGGGVVKGDVLHTLLVRAQEAHEGQRRTSEGLAGGMPKFLDSGLPHEEHIQMGAVIGGRQDPASLAQALQEAALRRQESALADMRVAEIYRGLSQGLQGRNTGDPPMRI